MIGTLGEGVAARYLERLGYKILERNARFGCYEIDIVARDVARDMLVFVEVKTRSTIDNDYPIRTSIDAKKRQAIRKAVDRWIIYHDYDDAGRIDVLCVSGERVIEHLMDLGSDFY